MKVFVALLSCLALAAAATIQHDLKHFMDDTTRVGRVVGGNEATSAEDYPYQILLRYRYAFTCGGSILNEKWCLTAAHCIDGRLPEDLQVQVGTHIAEDREAEIHDVELAIMHESYGNFGNDIALIKLADQLTWRAEVQPIKIWREPTAVGTQHILSGFGRTINGGPVAEKLKWTYSNLISRTNCVLGTGITSAGTCCYFAERNTGVCNGDSGGPAVIEVDGVKHQTGVANFVVGGCAAGNPDGYANATYFWDWIDSTMAKHSIYRLE